MSMEFDPDMIEYAIQSDDTLWDLADDYDTTPEAIIEANPGLDPDNMYVGQIIMIPGEMLPVNAEQYRRYRRDFRRPDFRRRRRRRVRRPYFRGPYRRYAPYWGYVYPYWWY